MLWIKSTLLDPTATLKQGWDRDKKVYVKDRRLALIKDNYVVIIRFVSSKKAKFVTAYEIDNEFNVQKILRSPDWK